MANRKATPSKQKPGSSSKRGPKTSGSTDKSKPVGRKGPASPVPTPDHAADNIVVYKVAAPATTMRSARGSWFMGTLSKDDRFYHYQSDATRDEKWVWGYTPHRYGCMNGFGWVALEDLDVIQETAKLDDAIRQKLKSPERSDSKHKGLTGEDFIKKYAHADHRPTAGSSDAEWPFSIKRGATVRFYINQRDGHPVSEQLHRTKPHLTSSDNGKVRYLVRENPNLMVVNLTGHGFWGFMLKEGDNFTVRFK